MRDHVQNPVDGTEIAYEVAGEGPPLLLVHGSGLSRGAWRGLGYLRDLERDFTVVAQQPLIVTAPTAPAPSMTLATSPATIPPIATPASAEAARRFRRWSRRRRTASSVSTPAENPQTIRTSQLNG